MASQPPRRAATATVMVIMVVNIGPKAAVMISAVIPALRYLELTSWKVA